MVVDYLSMSSVNFAIADFCSLIPNVTGGPSLHGTIPTEGHPRPTLRQSQALFARRPAKSPYVPAPQVSRRWSLVPRE